MSEFFEFIEMIFSIALALLIVTSPVIIYFIGVIVKESKAEKKYELLRKEKAEEKRRKEEVNRKRNQDYLAHMSSVYNNYSTQELQKIYKLLRTMHYNEYQVGEDGFSHNNTNLYFEAKYQLCDILGYPKDIYRGGHPFANYQIFATLDMNYVYRLLQTRGINL